MSSSSSAGHARSLPISTSALAWVFIASCVVMAIYVPVFDGANWEPIGSVVSVIAAGLVAAGLFALRWGLPRLAVALVVAGASLGALFLVWTLIVPILALALIVLFAWAALRAPSVAAASAS